MNFGPQFTDAMLNQWMYYTMQYLEPNSKSRGDGNHPLGSRCYNK